MEHKTALVLSAGGMFGAYQAGAWRAIAELAPPDIVVGASVGALNGLPISSGCTPDHLIERWLDPAAGDALKLFPNHGWRNGWFDPAPLRATAEQLWKQYRPRMPFGLVMVQLAWAACAPGAVSGYHAGTLAGDMFDTVVSTQRSGSAGNAIWMADCLRNCRSGRRWKWGPRELLRLIHCRMSANGGCIWVLISRMLSSRRGGIRPDLDLTVISPSGTLGDANDAVFWKRENVERWVDMGMRDAARALSGTTAAILGSERL